MRLIDADALEVHDGWLSEAEEYKTHISFVYSNDIENAPTIEVPEQKHGKWLERDCGFDVECKCSVCGYRDFIPTKHDRYWFNRNYCPNCGAKMDLSD